MIYWQPWFTSCIFWHKSSKFRCIPLHWGTCKLNAFQLNLFIIVYDSLMRKIPKKYTHTHTHTNYLRSGSRDRSIQFPVDATLQARGSNVSSYGIVRLSIIPISSPYNYCRLLQSFSMETIKKRFIYENIYFFFMKIHIFCRKFFRQNQ